MLEPYATSDADSRHDVEFTVIGIFCFFFPPPDVRQATL